MNICRPNVSKNSRQTGDSFLQEGKDKETRASEWIFRCNRYTSLRRKRNLTSFYSSPSQLPNSTRKSISQFKNLNTRGLPKKCEVQIRQSTDSKALKFHVNWIRIGQSLREMKCWRNESKIFHMDLFQHDFNSSKLILFLFPGQQDMTTTSGLNGHKCTNNNKYKLSSSVFFYVANHTDVIRTKIH